MALTRAKQELVTKKNESGLEYCIDKTDIVNLVRKAWKSSFARVLKNGMQLHSEVGDQVH
jgi:hypothetical protein